MTQPFVGGDPTCPSCGSTWRFYNLSVSGGAVVALDRLPCQATWHTPLGDPPASGRDKS